jgi:hypothetical protein
MKIRSVRDRLFYAEGLTQTKKVKVTFRNFGIAPKKQLLYKITYTFIRKACPDRKVNTNINITLKLI